MRRNSFLKPKVSFDSDIISRVEIIGPKGREIVTKGSYQFDIQDEGRTLKIFRNE